MTKKIHIGIVCGGVSAEHEVSLMSARNIIAAVDKERYECTIIGITQEGKWGILPQLSPVVSCITSDQFKYEIGFYADERGGFITRTTKPQIISPDVIIPVLHGPYGEDGTVQGLLTALRIPFVGSRVLGSAIGMDKVVMKQVLRDAKIPIVNFMWYTKSNVLPNYNEIIGKLGSPVFVKPANLGSSVGISKVTTTHEFEQAVTQAFQYDSKIIIEEAVLPVRELECAVLDGKELVVSPPGEIVTSHSFYSYEAKYHDPNGARSYIPAHISEEVKQQIRDLALKTFKILNAEGFARIDFFLKEDGTVLVNEINTIPGFTEISMYPKLMEYCGISTAEVINQLVERALLRNA